MSYSITDRLKLVNARIVDMAYGRCFGPEVSLIIQNGKIVAIPGLPGEPDAPGRSQV